MRGEGASSARAGRQETAGRATAVNSESSVQGRARLQIRGIGCVEQRTPNIRPMFVRLEVSKLSGWLNEDANCRESKKGHAVCVGQGMRVGRRKAAGDRGASSAQGGA